MRDIDNHNNDRRRLVVCLEKSLYLFDLETMRRLQDMDTARNARGLVALTPREEPRYVKVWVYVYVLCQVKSW